jgi:hypothetical protein
MSEQMTEMKYKLDRPGKATDYFAAWRRNKINHKADSCVGFGRKIYWLNDYRTVAKGQKKAGEEWTAMNC